jgi:hypothetical protein
MLECCAGVLCRGAVPGCWAARGGQGRGPLIHGAPPGRTRQGQPTTARQTAKPPAKPQARPPARRQPDYAPRRAAMPYRLRADRGRVFAACFCGAGAVLAALDMHACLPCRPSVCATPPAAGRVMLSPHAIPARPEPYHHKMGKARSSLRRPSRCRLWRETCARRMRRRNRAACVPGFEVLKAEGAAGPAWVMCGRQGL